VARTVARACARASDGANRDAGVPQGGLAQRPSPGEGSGQRRQHHLVAD